MAEETPLFAQYTALKAQHPNEVLFFRVGDFYEMFDSDADEVSRLLNLTLTHRAEKHMCGVPYHAAKVYIARLLRYGKKVAIAEQIGEIAQHGKGITRRDVTEIITPGTAVESEYLDGGKSNFLASAFTSKAETGFAYLDVTTGEFRATHFLEKDLGEELSKEIGRVSPRELLLPAIFRDDARIKTILEANPLISVSYYPDWNFNAEVSYKRLLKQFNVATLRSFSLTEASPEVVPAGFLLDYLEKTTNTHVPHIAGIQVYQDSQYVIIDDSSRRNLEITGNLRDGTVQFSLLECVDHTRTAMGARLIREWLSFPLTNKAKIESRQSHVELFVSDRNLLRRLQEKLDGILDIERLSSRIALDKAHAKDLTALANSLSLWLITQEILCQNNFATLDSKIAQNIINVIRNALLDDPATVFTEGRIIRPGWSEELDYWRNMQDNFSKILDEYTEEEKAKTGIQNLRIKQTGNLGYFIEITKGKISKVPSHFIIRRALVNADRYTTARLQELEQNLNEAGGKILELEHSLFVELRASLKQYVSYLQQTAKEIAYVDAVSSFSQSAISNKWVRPVLEDSEAFCVAGGRHPVVEAHLPMGEFIPNDLSLFSKEEDASFALITGPNMAGKSTYLRQNALISLLAQTGSFVPCTKARLGIVDRIFCRVGASDNLAKGESTFLVEMTETAHILRGATKKSLVIMDEVGRGTSTEDGLSIAWAVSEYLLNTVQCKTLFATHYHELTRMSHPMLKMLHMAVSEEGGKITFLRRVISGASENSYGIHVAALAGVPAPVIDRASFILTRIQDEAAEKPIISVNQIEESADKEKKAPPMFSGSLFSEEEMVLNEILSCDVDTLQPIKALELLDRWKKTLEP